MRNLGKRLAWLGQVRAQILALEPGTTMLIASPTPQKGAETRRELRSVLRLTRGKVVFSCGKPPGAPARLKCIRDAEIRQQFLIDEVDDDWKILDEYPQRN